MTMPSEDGIFECPCCARCNECPDFQKVMELEEAGLVIYRHGITIDVNKVANFQNIPTAEDVFIFHNTRDTEIKSSDFISDLDISRIGCPRCRHIVEHAHKLLQNLSIDRKDIRGICDHCRKSLKSCLECKKILNKFLSTKEEGENAKEQVKNWVTKIQQFFQTETKAEKRKQTDRAYSEPHLEKLCEKEPKWVREPEIEQLLQPKLSDTARTIPMTKRSYQLNKDEDIRDLDSDFYYPTAQKLRKTVIFDPKKYQEALPYTLDHELPLSDEDLIYAKEQYTLGVPDKVYKQPDTALKEFDEKHPERPFQVFDDKHPDRALKVFDDKRPNKDLKIFDDKYPDRTLKVFDDKYPDRALKVFDDKHPEEPQDIEKSQRGQKLAKDYDLKLNERLQKSKIPKKIGETIQYPDTDTEPSLQTYSQISRDSQIEKKIKSIKSTKLQSVLKSRKSVNYDIEMTGQLPLSVQRRLIQDETKVQPEALPTLTEEIYSKEPREPSSTEPDELQKDFSFRFPKKIIEEKKKPVKQMSSTELIKHTQDMLLIKAEEETKRREKAKKLLLEEKEKQRLAREEKRRLKEEEKRLQEEKRREEQKRREEEERKREEEERKREEERQKREEEKRQREEEEKRKREEEERRRQELAAKQRELQKKSDKAKSIGSEPSKKQLKSAEVSHPVSVKSKKSRTDTIEKEKKTPIDKSKADQEKEIKPKIEKSKPILEKPKVEQKEKVATETDIKKILPSPKEKEKKEEPIVPKVEKLEETSGKQKSDKEDRKEPPKPKEEKVKEKDTVKEKPTDKKKDNAAADQLKKALAEQAKKAAEEEKLRKQQEENERKAREAAEKNKKGLEEGQKVTKKEVKPEPEKPKPEKKPEEPPKDLAINQIKVKKPSPDDLILQLVRLKQTDANRQPKEKPSKVASETKIEPPPKPKHKTPRAKKVASTIVAINSDMILDMEENLAKKKIKPDEMADMIIGDRIFRYKPPVIEKPKTETEKQLPGLLTSEFHDDIHEDKEADKVYSDEVEIKVTTLMPPPGKGNKVVIEQEAPKGVIHYALSDRTFIDKGWTMLPTEKVVRKMNVYRMRPAHPEFDWFEHNKNKRLMQYDSGEKLAEFDDNGRGRWYYRNGRLALDYYDAEETNAQQRFVVYSSGEPDERGRSHPITILATFDYLGNGIVFDHSGKIRLKYNQTEGVVLDRAIGPVSHWKWHTLNDPPVLQQVMIDTQVSHKDPEILKLGGPGDDKTRPDNEEMLAIEFDNFIKEKSKKLSQKFKPFQIKMKALKINEHFSLRVLDQATIYLIYRDGTTNLKLNIGMILDHQEIVDTDTAEVGEVSNNLERFPARTDSLAALQRSVAYAQRYERSRTERERRLRPPEPCASADLLTSGVSRPLRVPLRTVPSGSTVTGACQCKYRKPPCNLYYDTRLV